MIGKALRLKVNKQRRKSERRYTSQIENYVDKREEAKLENRKKHNILTEKSITIEYDIYNSVTLKPKDRTS